MDLEKVCDALNEFIQGTPFKKYEFDGSTEGAIELRIANVTLAGLDDDIAVNIGVFESGSAFVELIFDKIKDVKKAAVALNEFNKQSIWLKAYISDKQYLTVNHTILCLQDENVLVNVVGHVLSYVGSNTSIALLAPLCKLTKA